MPQDMTKLWTVRLYQDRDPRNPSVIRDRFDDVALLASGQEAARVFLRCRRLRDFSLWLLAPEDARRFNLDPETPIRHGT